jgi:hypothetical protein
MPADHSDESSVDKSGGRVRGMFAEIAPRYDLVNRIPSGGIDVWWRYVTVNRAPPPAAGAVLDVCTGTGITGCSPRITSSGPPSPPMTKGNVGKRRDAATGGHAAGGHATGDCCDSCDKPRSHDSPRIAWAKLMARVGEEFPVACPGCGGDIHRRVDRRQEPAHFEPEVRKRKKARMASPA